MEEIWKDIEGYEGYYQISNFGRVKSLSRLVIQRNGNNYLTKEKLMKIKQKRNKYLFVTLTLEGSISNKYIHRLVLYHFGYKDGCGDLQVNHKDFNVINNRVDNLEWVTYRQNFEHRFINGRVPKGEQVSNSKLTGENVLNIKKEIPHKTLSEIAEKYEVSFQNISNIKRGKTWKHI